MLTAEKVRCSPASPCSRATGRAAPGCRCGLRLLPGISFVPCPRAVAWAPARSGRESRLSDRTGKQDLRCRRLDDSVAFRIKRDDANRCPVAGLPAPALRVACACILVERVAGGEHAAIQSGMTLRRDDVAGCRYGGVRGYTICTKRAAHCRAGVQIGEPLERELRPILRGAEQRLGKGVVITDLRAESWDGLMPSQCSMANTVVALQSGGAVIATCSTGRTDMVCTPSASAVRLARWTACSALSVSWTSKPTTLRPVEVQDQVEIEPVTLDLCRQECGRPSTRPRRGGSRCGGARRARRPWRLSPASAVPFGHARAARRDGSWPRWRG